jgi:hypothetical protein
VLRRRKANLLVLVGYTAVSFAYFGWRLLPHPGRELIGYGHDPQIFVWSFAWWPHAIGAWTNPFYTHAVYSPSGINLAWVTSVPGLALAFAPVTVLFGPDVSFNLAMLLLPALAAWTAFLLCHYLTRSLWASLVGGYIFGLSSYVLAHEHGGHPNLVGIFPLPLLALAIVRYVRAEIGARGLAWRLGLLLALQLSISTETAVTLTVALALSLVLGLVLFAEHRHRLVASLAPIACGYVLAAVLTLPLVVYLVTGFVSADFTNPAMFGADLLNLVVPTPLTALGGSSSASVAGHFMGNYTERGLYLGLPVLLMVVILAVRRWHSPGVRFLVAALALGLVITAGTALHVNGRRLLALPWAALTHVPVLAHVLPVRFTAYVALAASVLVALWTATTPGRIYSRPYVLPALAVAVLAPAAWRASYPSVGPTHPERVAFFTDGAYRRCIPRDETIAIFPWGGDPSNLWQAETNFWFRVAGNGLQPFTYNLVPANRFDADPVVWNLDWSASGRPTMDWLLAFAVNHRVGRVVVKTDAGYPSRAQLRRYGSVQAVGGVLVAPACGQPPLRARDAAHSLVVYREQVSHPRSIAWCTPDGFSVLQVGLVPDGGTRAIFVAGRGLTCPPPPPGYRDRGFATTGVPPHTYHYYAP